MFSPSNHSNCSTEYISCKTCSGLEPKRPAFHLDLRAPTVPSTTVSSKTTESRTSVRACTVFENRLLLGKSRFSKNVLQATANTSQSTFKPLESLPGESISTETSDNLQEIAERTSAGLDSSSYCDDIKSVATISTTKNLYSTPKNKNHKIKMYSKPLPKRNRTKRQLALIQRYEKMSHCLNVLLRQQKNRSLTKKKDRIRNKQQLNKIRSLFKVLRKKLRKRDRIDRLLQKKRMQREHRKRVHLRLKKILRVVYFKRQQRINNMRLLRIRERKRLADTLMLQAAKLRARANRLTGGCQRKCRRRRTTKRKQGLRSLESRKSESRISSAQLEVNENNVEKKKIVVRKTKKPKLSKNRKKQKVLDADLNKLSDKMQTLLRKFSIYTKKHKPMCQANEKCAKNSFNNEIVNSNSVNSQTDCKKNEKQKKRNNRRKISYRRPRQAWWRKDKLRAAKIFREKPKLDDFGSDSDLYDVAIASKTSTKSSVLTAIHA